MVAPPYRRVPQNEGNAARSSSSSSSSSSSQQTSSSSSSSSRSERISIKLHALLWVIGAYALASYTQLFHTIITDERILRPSLYISLFAFTLNGMLMLYLTIYLPYKFPTDEYYTTNAGLPQFWNAYCPSVTPIITASSVIGSFFLCRACFPIWGFFFTPLLLSVVGLGIFFSLHFIPVFGV